MKSNQEIAASVFEKSKAVIKKRAERRKKIAAAASTLGVAAVITVLAIVGKGFPSGNNPIPTESGSSSASEPKTVSSQPDTDTAIDTSSIVSDKENTSHQNESKAESKHESSENNTISKESSSSRTGRRNPVSSASASAANGRRTTTTITTHDDEDISSDAASSKITSSKTESSNNSSSKTSSFSTTVSSTSSQKTTASKPSVKDSDEDTETPSTDSDVIPNSPPPDSDQELPTPTDDSDTSTADTDIETVETDAAAVEHQFYNVNYIGQNYDSVSELANSADRVVIARVESVGFVSMGDDLVFLKDNIEKPDRDLASKEEYNKIYGDIVAVYTIVIEENLSYDDEKDAQTVVNLFVYGGKPDMYYFDQVWAVGDSSMIPAVYGMTSIDEGETYVFLLKEQNGITTLLTPEQGVYNTDSQGVASESGFTAADIIGV